MRKQLKQINLLKNQKGFSLLELLLVLAIIVILSGVILVTVESQRKKARENKMLTELSAVLQPILMCYSDGGEVNGLNSETNICKIDNREQPSYGKWPKIPEEFDGSEENDFPESGGKWYFSVANENVMICCNNYSGKCGLMGKDDGCGADTSVE